MSYQVFLAKNEKFIICQVSGEMTVETAKQFAAEIHNLSQEKNLKKFLIDVRQAPNISSIMQNYKFIYNDLNELDFQRNALTAILVNKGDHSHDFVETVSLNAGYNVKICDNEEEAIKWFDEEG